MSSPLELGVHPNRVPPPTIYYRVARLSDNKLAFYAEATPVQCSVITKRGRGCCADSVDTNKMGIAVRLIASIKLDGVGPIDNRTSTD